MNDARRILIIAWPNGAGSGHAGLEEPAPDCDPGASMRPDCYCFSSFLRKLHKG